MSAVILDGARKFSGDLEKGARSLADLSLPMMASAKTVRQAASSAAPRLTGTLASSLVAKADALDAAVGTTVEYANPIHWGWRAHGIEPNKFLTESARRTESSWIRNFEDRLDDIISTMDRNYAR